VAAAFAAVLLGIRIFVIGSPPPSVLGRIPGREPYETTGAAVGDLYRGGETDSLVVREVCDVVEETAPDGVADLPASEESSSQSVTTAMEALHSTASGQGEELGELEEAGALSVIATGSSGGDGGEAAACDERLEDTEVTGTAGTLVPGAGGYQTGQAWTEESANRSMQVEGVVDDTISRIGNGEESPVEEAFAETVFAAGPSTTSSPDAALSSTECDSTAPAGLVASWYSVGQEQEDEESTAPADSDMNVGYGWSGGGGTLSGEEILGGASGDQAEAQSLENAAAPERQRRDGIDGTIGEIEQAIAADWRSKSVEGYGSTLLPALVTISFSIAPDGTVYDVVVTLPSDSLFLGFSDEIESRIGALVFEEAEDAESVTVEMDMVLY